MRGAMELLTSIDMIALSVPLNGFYIIALHIQCLSIPLYGFYSIKPPSGPYVRGVGSGI
jgi:hypothetical protein